MKIFIALFKKEDLYRNIIKLYGNQFDEFKTVFPNYLEESKNIDKGIIYIKGKANGSEKSFMVNIKNIDASVYQIVIEIDSVTNLDESSGSIDKRLYRFAREHDWVNQETGYYPIMCFVDDNSFDIIRKGTSNKTKAMSSSAELDECRKNNDWLGICKMYEPLENIQGKDIWENSLDLYQVAFACSKLGELQNGKEKDNSHILFIKRYRDLSLRLYKRCFELGPYSIQYSSAVAYRHYQNFIELSKPKGRKDGNKQEEYEEATNWFDISLKLSPRNIKVNYRKAKLIGDYLPIYKFSQKEWTRETFKKLEELEKTLVICFETVIEEYSKLKDNSFVKNEYVKALYNLGAHYLEKLKTLDKYKYNYALCIFNNEEVAKQVSAADMENIDKAYSLYKKCIEAETNVDIENQYNYEELLKASDNWAIKPSDKYYRLGLANLFVYYMRKLNNQNNEKTEEYGKIAERYLSEAKKFAMSRGKLHKHITEKLAWYYIIKGDYNKAVKLTDRLQDSYCLNTYATALMLSNIPNKFNKAKNALKQAENDRFNLAKDTTNFILGSLPKLEESSI